jgi:hypothetical protein
MARIAVCELQQVVMDLPVITTLESSLAEATSDLFVCALGFEPRCTAVPEALRSAGQRFTECVFICLDTNVAENNRNRESLEEHLRSLGDSVTPLNADASDFSVRLRLLLSRMSQSLNRAPRVTFDISVAANRLLLRTFQVLLEADIDLRLTYAEAGTYHPTRQEYEADPSRWEGDDTIGTEQGVSLVVPSPSYAGQHLDPLPNYVILFPSFRKDRSLAVLSAVDETLLTSRHQDVVWVIGIPHAEQDQWRMDAMRSINRIPASAHQIEVSTFDYRETLFALERLHQERWEQYNLTISPLGSKLQGVGTALFCYLRPEVRVMFSAPKVYNANEWSSGCMAKWQIRFGATSVVRDCLRQVGTIALAR